VKGICPEVTFLAGADDAHHLGADALDGDVQGLQDAGREALFLASRPSRMCSVPM